MKHNIMVVDDSRVVYAEMKMLLYGIGTEIVSFCRIGEEALQEYERVRPELVTMDIVMPGMDGLETCREMRRRWPDAQVVMVSSLAYDDMVEQARSLGAKGFLFKPFEKQALIDGLKNALGDENCQ